jgi:hypothetical protein
MQRQEAQYCSPKELLFQKERERRERERERERDIS